MNITEKEKKRNAIKKILDELNYFRNYVRNKSSIKSSNQISNQNSNKNNLNSNKNNLNSSQNNPNSTQMNIISQIEGNSLNNDLSSIRSLSSFKKVEKNINKKNNNEISELSTNNNNNNINIFLINSNLIFYKYFLFDSYLSYNNEGNYQFFILREMLINLNSFYNVTKNNNIFKLYSLLKSTEKKEYEKLHFYLDNKKETVLLSGYTKELSSGHAILLYIKKIEENKFNLYIFNSGEGIKNHYLNKNNKKNDKNKPIGIVLEDLTLIDIEIIYYYHIFFHEKINETINNKTKKK